jgi:hypothetical protein
MMVLWAMVLYVVISMNVIQVMHALQMHFVIIFPVHMYALVIKDTKETVLLVPTLTNVLWKLITVTLTPYVKMY